MNIAELHNKRVLVVGLGVTGMSVVRFLTRHGIPFELADEKASKECLPELSRQPVFHSLFTAELFCQFDVIVLSPGVPRAHPAIVKALDTGAEVVGDIELFANAVTVPVIAVTGSNGKSTVVAWLANALGACGMKVEACGNIGDPALDALLSDVDVLVLEVSSYQLESTFSLRPLSAAVLNISDDHRDRYDSIDHYASVKRGVYQHAANRVVNGDDERTWPLDDVHVNSSCFTLNDSDQVRCRWHQAVLGETVLAVPGNHNVANALAVVALAAPLGVAEEKLIASLKGFKGLPHRSEFIGENEGVRWYNDSKGTNVDACQKAVMAMPGPVILIAGGLGKGADFSPLDSTMRQFVKLLILIGQDRQIIASQLKGCTETIMADTVKQAVQMASARASAGDVVLLSPACASFDMFKNFEDRGEQFTAAVQEELAA